MVPGEMEVLLGSIHWTKGCETTNITRAGELIRSEDASDIIQSANDNRCFLIIVKQQLLNPTSRYDSFPVLLQRSKC